MASDVDREDPSKWHRTPPSSSMSVRLATPMVDFDGKFYDWLIDAIGPHAYFYTGHGRV
jgi:hypothetical protein